VRDNHPFGRAGRRRGRFTSRIRRGEPNSGPASPSGLNPEEEVELLKRRGQIVSRRLEEIRQKIEDQKRVGQQRSQGETVAIVDEEECAGCGLCCEVCPMGAISMNGVAKIDPAECTACLACVKQCPQGAIAVKYRE
jgi:ferredoxin